jgi:hypothetical protein
MTSPCEQLNLDGHKDIVASCALQNRVQYFLGDGRDPPSFVKGDVTTEVCHVCV